MYAPWLEYWLIKRPLLTALLSAAIAVVAGLGVSIELRELRGFGSTPQTVEVSDLPPPPPGDFAPGRWIEVRGPLRFDCASLLVERSWQEGEIIFGHRALTYLPATDPQQTRLLIFVADGAHTCDDVMRSRWRGVIREASKYDLEKPRAKGFRPPQSLLVPAMRFETYGGPRESSKMAALALFALCLMSFGAVHFWRKYEQSQQNKLNPGPKGNRLNRAMFSL